MAIASPFYGAMTGAPRGPGVRRVGASPYVGGPPVEEAAFTPAPPTPVAPEPMMPPEDVFTPKPKEDLPPEQGFHDMEEYMAWEAGTGDRTAATKAASDLRHEKWDSERLVREESERAKETAKKAETAASLAEFASKSYADSHKGIAKGLEGLDWKWVLPSFADTGSSVSPEDYWGMSEEEWSRTHRSGKPSVERISYEGFAPESYETWKESGRYPIDTWPKEYSSLDWAVPKPDYVSPTGERYSALVDPYGTGMYKTGPVGLEYEEWATPSSGSAVLPDALTLSDSLKSKEAESFRLWRPEIGIPSGAAPPGGVKAW